MENIVRPFESVRIDPKPGFESIPKVVPNVVLMVGTSGGGAQFSGNYSAHVSVYADRVEKEQ